MAFEARDAGLLRIVDTVVVVPVEDVDNAGTDTEGFWAKKSVNFLFLALKELLAGILVAGVCVEDGRQ